MTDSWGRSKATNLALSTHILVEVEKQKKNISEDTLVVEAIEILQPIVEVMKAVRAGSNKIWKSPGEVDGWQQAFNKSLVYKLNVFFFNVKLDLFAIRLLTM